MFKEHTKVEYIKKNKKYLKGTERFDVETGQKIAGSGSRTKGIRKGVMVAIIGDNNNVEIGFSLCSKLDKFNEIPPEWTELLPSGVMGIELLGFGETLAALRARRWCEYDKVLTTMKKLPKKHLNTVHIPRSIEGDLKRFIGRCARYYKDKTLPPWTNTYLM